MMFDESMSLMLEELFQEQKDSFINSLERSISVVGSDQFLNQLFKDKRSTSYIPDRICDIIQQCLHDDREDYISQIFSKLRAIETCFGPKLSYEIEEIGSKLLSIPASSPENETKRQLCLQKLENQLKKIQSEYFSRYNNNYTSNTTRDIKFNIESLKNSFKSLSNSFDYFQSEMLKNFRTIKSQINSKYLNNSFDSYSRYQNITNSQLDVLRQENMTLKTLLQVQKNSKSYEQEKEEEIERLKRSLREYKTRIDELIYENQSSKANLNRTQEKFNKIKKFAKTNDDNDSFSELDKDSSFDETDLLDYIKKLKRENQFAKSEISKLRTQNEKLTDENIEFRSQSTLLTTNVSEQSKNLEEKSTVVQRLEIENNQLKNVNNQLLTASKNLQQQNKEALDQVSSLKQENATIRRKLTLLAKKYQRNENEKLNLQSQISSLSNLNETSKADSNAFKEATTKEIQLLKTQNNELTIENTKLTSQLESFKESSTMNLDELTKKNEMNSKLNEQNIQLNSQIQVIQSKLTAIESNKDVSEEKLQILQGKFSQLENENRILRNENQELQNLHQKTLSNCAELKDHANTLTELNTKLTIQNSDLKSINEASKGEKKLVSTFKDQLEKLQNEYSESLMTITRLKQENSALNSTQMEIHNYKEKIEKLTAENNEFQNIFQQTKKEIRSLESTIDEKERKISELNYEKTKVESRLKESEDKLYSIQNANGLIGTKADQIVTLASQNDILKNSIQSSEANLMKANEDNAKLVKALQKSQIKIESLKQDLIKVLSANDELVNKNQTLNEIKRRVMKLGNSSQSRFASSFSTPYKNDQYESEEMDNIERISDTLHNLEQENKDKSKTLNKIELFQRKVFNLIGATNDKEAERLLDKMLQKQKEDSLVLTRIREILNIKPTDNILLSFREKLKKLDDYIDKERQLRKTLKINPNGSYIFDDEEEMRSETLKAILLLKAKAENNESFISRQLEQNNAILKRLCSLFQTSENSKLPIFVQAIQEQINDARIKFKQLREALDITNDDEIVDSVQTLVLKLKEEEENIQKVRISLKCNDNCQLPQKAFETKSKANIMNEVKSLIKVEKDEDVTQSIQKLLTFQNRVKSSVQISNNNNNSELTPLTVFYNADDEHLKLKQIQDNESILSQLCLILKNENKNEFPLIVQTIKNCVDQACQLIHITSYNQLIPSLTRLINENSQINGLQTKISEKNQKVSQMKKMMQSLESQVTEISSFSNDRKIQTEATSEEISNLQSSLKSSSRKMKSLLSKIDKKNDIISSLKQSLISLQKENETILNQKSFLDTSMNETQTQIKKIENDLKIDSINQIPQIVNDLRSQLASFSEDPFKNENEMKRINTFRSCLKEISALLISTDIHNFAKEIEELKDQNEELLRMKNHLTFALSLKMNESLTTKIDEIVKTANDSQAIFGKLCILLDVPSKEEIPSAVDSLIREVKEMKNHSKMLQSAASVNSQQTLLKSIKTMKRNVTNFIERYNLNDESELVIMDHIMKACEVDSINELQTKINSMIESVSILNDVQKKLNVTSPNEVNLIILKNSIYDKLNDIISLNFTSTQNLNDSIEIGTNESNFVLKSINDLIKMKITLEKVLNTQFEGILNKVTNLIQFKNAVIQGLNANNSDDVESMIQRLGQFEEHEEEICKILNISNPVQINDEINSLIEIAQNQKRLMKFFNAENNMQLMDTVSQLSKDARASQKANQLLDGKDETDIQLLVQEFVKKEKKICKLLCLTDPSLILSRVSALKSINDKLVEMFNTADIIPAAQNVFDILNNICSILQYEKVTLLMINNSSQQSSFQSQLSQESELKFIGVDKAVEKLNNDYSTVIAFFSRLFAILYGQEHSINNITVQFPLSSEFEQKIVSSVTEMKEQNDQCQVIIAKAKASGFEGSNCVEAVDFLISNLKDQEKLNISNETQKISHKMKSEIKKEKKNAEKEQQELKKKIDELQQKIDEMKKNEENLNKKLKREKKKRETMNMSLLKEKEVNQSLVTIMHGNTPYATDSQINRSSIQ